MRLKRLVSAEPSRRLTSGCCGCAAVFTPARWVRRRGPLLDEVISGVFDSELERGDAGARRIERYLGTAGFEHDRRSLHSGNRLEYARHARRASVARHATHFEADGFRCRFHIVLSIRVAITPRAATASVAVRWQPRKPSSPPWRRRR